MRYFFIIVYMLLLPILLIAFLWKILDKLEKLEEENIKTTEEKKVVRKHKTIAHSDFDNAFGGRKAYSIYKNKDGLYEPITPSKGISLKKKEE